MKDPTDENYKTIMSKIEELEDIRMKKNKEITLKKHELKRNNKLIE
jgi:hypothetical protein